MRIVFGLLTLALCGLQYKLWLGNDGFKEWHHWQHRLTCAREHNAALAARNHTIEADVAELKDGQQALEEQARYALGMIKGNEIYYQCLE